MWGIWMIQWIIAVLIVFFASIKIVYEYERGVKFTLGKFSGVMKPGLRLVIPLFQSWKRMDLRVTVIDVPDQDCITKDNVSVKVNAVLYFSVQKAEHAVIQVEDYLDAVSQLAQTTMRNVVGEATLDELLSNRDQISKKIESIVDKATNPWGIDVSSVDLKDISLPEQMRRSMAQEAESERERRALIIVSEGEKVASTNIKQAAKVLSASKGALHLRTLQNFSDIASDDSNTMIFAVPIEGIDALEREKK